VKVGSWKKVVTCGLGERPSSARRTCPEAAASEASVSVMVARISAARWRVDSVGNPLCYALAMTSRRVIFLLIVGILIGLIVFRSA
jgi:hypothetical protein